MEGPTIAGSAGLAVNSFMKTSANRRSLVGNIANQKYEASRHIERHIEIVQHTPASPETTRWRDSEPYYFMKQEGRLVVQERLLNADNQLLNERLHDLATEDRLYAQKHAYAFAPGWRAGKGGVFIDCYPPINRVPVMETMKKKQDFARYTTGKKIEKENLLIAKFLESARASYGREELRKKYARNRQSYNLFSSRTPHTALHLGLVKTVKERVERRNRLAAHHYSAISAATSKSRPKSAPSNTNQYDRRLLREADKIRDIHDFYDLKDMDRQMRGRAGEWDPSTNDNLVNSGRNVSSGRDGTVYAKKVDYKDVQYLSHARNIAEVMQGQGKGPTAAKSSSSRPHTASRVDLLDVPPARTARSTSSSAAPSTRQPQSGESRLREAQRAPEPVAGVEAEAKDSMHPNLVAMQKLGHLRKNVSFVEAQAATAERRASFLREASSGMISGLTADDGADEKSPGVRSRLYKSASVVSDLGTDEDPTGPPPLADRSDSRRMSVLLDMHFEEDAHTGRSVPHSHHSLPQLEAPTRRSATAQSLHADLVLSSLRVHFSSAFHLPVRCRSLECPVMCPVLGEDAPAPTAMLSLYDVGYFLPGNEDYPQCQAILLATQQEAANANALKTAEMVFMPKVEHSSARPSPAKPQAPSPLSIQATNARALRQVEGLSLPTSTGLLLVASAADVDPLVPSAFLFLTLNELLVSPLCAYEDSLPRAVVSEMLAFAYPYGSDFPLSTPRDSNSYSSPVDRAQCRVVIDHDVPKAMVVPCMMDMMETDILEGFTSAVASRAQVRWDSGRLALSLTA